MASKSLNLNISVNGKNLFVTPTGVKLGTKGAVRPALDVLANLPKSERRKIRKAARAAGAHHVARAR